MARNENTLPLPNSEQAVPEDREQDDGGRRMDPELRTMGAMLRMLGELDAEARGRVVDYLASRFPKEPF